MWVESFRRTLPQGLPADIAGDLQNSRGAETAALPGALSRPSSTKRRFHVIFIGRRRRSTLLRSSRRSPGVANVGEIGQGVRPGPGVHLEEEVVAGLVVDRRTRLLVCARGVSKARKDQLGGELVSTTWHEKATRIPIDRSSEQMAKLHDGGAMVERRQRQLPWSMPGARSDAIGSDAFPNFGLGVERWRMLTPDDDRSLKIQNRFGR